MRTALALAIQQSSSFCLPKLLQPNCSRPWLCSSVPCFSRVGNSAKFSRCTQSVRAVAALTGSSERSGLALYNPIRNLGSSLLAASLGQTGHISGYVTEMGEKGGRVEESSPVVSVDWLHDRLKDPQIKVLDGSWYMPNDKRNPFEEFKVSHIPGALFFDVDGVVDFATDLPHMLPSETAFAAAVSALGIKNDDTIVVYDGKGIFSAARVWWIFRVFGHENVVVLDGGLPLWRVSGYDVESSASTDLLARIQAASECVKKAYQGEQVDTSGFKTKFQPHLVWSLQQVKNNIDEKTHQHIDARSKARFDGVAPEPRKGIRGGHVPGSKCIPFNEVLKDGETLLPTKELQERFKDADISIRGPVVASCGTGITACVLLLALHRLGKSDVAVYDGSWTEWGGVPDTPVATNVPPSTS